MRYLILPVALCVIWGTRASTAPMHKMCFTSCELRDMGVGNMTISLHDGTSCKRGEGLVFEESSASLDQLGFLLGPPFTISVRFVSKEIKSRTRIFDFSNGGGKHNIFLANTEKSSQMLLGVVNSNSFTRVKTGLPLVQNGWSYHLIFTCDSDSYCSLYLNGLKKYNGTIQIAKVARSLLYLGKSPHGDPQLNGAIREIAFWDKGINATLASQLSSARGCYKRKQVLRSSTGTFDHVFWKSQNSRSANAILLGAKPTKDPTKYPTHLPSRFPTPTAATFPTFAPTIYSNLPTASPESLFYNNVPTASPESGWFNINIPTESPESLFYNNVPTASPESLFYNNVPTASPESLFYNNVPTASPESLFYNNVPTESPESLFYNNVPTASPESLFYNNVPTASPESLFYNNVPTASPESLFYNNVPTASPESLFYNNVPTASPESLFYNNVPTASPESLFYNNVPTASPESLFYNNVPTESPESLFYNNVPTASPESLFYNNVPTASPESLFYNNVPTASPESLFYNNVPTASPESLFYNNVPTASPESLFYNNVPTASPESGWFNNNLTTDVPTIASTNFSTQSPTQQQAHNYTTSVPTIAFTNFSTQSPTQQQAHNHTTNVPTIASTNFSTQSPTQQQPHNHTTSVPTIAFTNFSTQSPTEQQAHNYTTIVPTIASKKDSTESPTKQQQHNHTTSVPSLVPTILSTLSPTTILLPTGYPIASPSVCPSLFSIPTNSPLTSLPTTSHPSLSPSTSPSFLAPSRCPITEAPATCIPTTLHPTFLPSQSPATQSPLSRSPLTRAPFTFSPSSKSPTTSTPTSGVPTQVPSTRVPSSVAPSSTPHTGKPTTRAPSSSPITSAPTTVAPTAVNLAALRSTWESSFTAFTVEYSLPTDTQQHSCLEYFLDEDDGGSVSDKLGLQPNCHWLSQTTLKVTLGKGFSLELESTIKLRGGVVHDLSGRKVAAVVTLLVQHSAVPILRPDAVLWGPQGAAPCETLQLTTDGSSGSAGKPLNISWTLIQSPANGEEAKLNALRVILDSATQGNSKSITFESDLLAGGLHVFFVQIRNWVGGISDARWQITKSNAAAPVVTIPGQTSMSIARSEVLAIRTIVSPPACNATSLLDTEYTSEAFWSQIIPSSASNSNGYNAIVMNGSSFSDDSISIPKPQNSYLLLPANILRMGETYGFNLRSRALYQGHVVGESNTVFQVRVRVEPVQAVISGGSAVTVIVRNGLESSFDASLSTDPSNSAFPLAFEWTMVDAGGNSVPITSHLASVSSPTNSSILKLQTGDLQPGSKYKLWVKVTGQTINGTARFSSASQEIYTSQANVPLVRAYISSSSTEGASGEKKFNINKKLNLLAEVSNYRVSEVRFSWSCASFNLNVSNPNNLRSGTDSQYFVVAANALLAGAAYQFRVETQEIYGGSSSFALVDVTTNGPPILGNCSALPNQGLALSTVFQLQCREWVDDDVPLSFKFSNRLSSGAWAVVSEFQSKSFFNTLLPAGSGAGDVMPLRASIRDVLGAQTYYDFQAVVETEVIDTSVLTTSIDQRVAEGDTQTASLLVQGMATYLRSSSAENINNTEKASSIERLLEQTTSLSEVSSTSAESSENTASLCSAATDFNSPDEINANTRNLAANLVENLLNSSVGLSSDAIKSSMSCMSNTLDSLVLGSNTESDDSGSYTEELEKVREKTRQTTLKLSEQMLQDSLPGEEPVEVSLPRLSLVAAKTTIADAKGTQLRSTAGVSITLPDLTTTTSSSSSSSSTEDTIINTLEFKPGYAAPYPGNTANISGVLSLDIKKNGRILNVKDVAYFPMYFPQKLTDLSVDPNAVPICQFWNTTLGNWSSSGLRPATDSSLGNVGCETTHLTSFSFRIGFEFNTFGEKDINAEAFELQQPIMAFLFAVFGIYVIGSFWACKKDLEDAHDMPEFHSELFWRKRNKLVYDTMWKVRSFRILKERFRFILSVRHPWSSVFSREKGDYLNSFKRFTILTTLIFNSTAICSLLEGTKQQIPLLPSSVAVAVVAMILTLPVPILMNKLFSRPVPPEFSVQIEKPDYNCVFLLFLALIAALLGDEIDLGGGQRGSSGGNGENTDGFEEEVEEIEDDNEDDNHNPFARQSSEVAIGLGLMTGGVVAMKDDRKETKEQPNQPRDQQKIHDNKTSRNLIIRQNGLVRRHSGLDLSSCLASEGWIVAMEVEEQEENDDNDYDNKDHDKKHKTPLDTYSQRSVKGKVTTGARSADYSNYNRRMRIRHKRPLCCGIFYPGPYVYNQEYVTTDIAGILFAILVIFGCWFITAVLAFRAGNKTAAWVISEILCLIQDVVSRFVVSGMLEMFVFAPFVIVFCACIFCYTDPATEEEEAVPRGDPRKAVGFTRKFEVGRLGFSFQNLKVCNVVKGSQADRVLAPGMEILMVNYKPVNSDREIYTELQSGHRIGSHIVVSFDRSGRCQRRLSMKTIPQLRSTSGKFLRTKLPETVLESSFVLDSEANKNRSSDILKPSSVLSRTTTNLSRQNRGHRDSRLNSSSPRLLDRASELELQQIDSIPTMGKITQLDNVEEEDEKKRKKVMFKFKEATEGKARIFLTSSTTSGVIRESVSSEHKIHAMRSSVLSEHQLYASMGKGNRKSRFRTKV